MEIIHIASVDELRQLAFDWDDLWWRSETTVPTVRAELIAQWLEQFAPHSRFHGLAVRHDGRLVAALPLVGVKKRKMIRVGSLPTNSWSPSGDLLVDLEADHEGALDLLASALRQLPWKMLWLDEALPETARWQSLITALERANMRFVQTERYKVGRLPISGDYESCRHMRSKNFRKSVNKSIRRLEAEGELCLRVESPAIDDVAPLLRRGFEVEDKSWKGQAGTSILRSSGIPEFYTRQAELLAEHGQLILAFLEYKGQAIAYEYAFSAKGVFHCLKIGYDEEFAWASPGQLLMHKLLERFHDESTYQTMDFMGPLSSAVDRLKPDSYSVGRLVIATRGILSRAALFGYEHVWRRAARRRESSQNHSAIPAQSTAKP